MALLVAGIVLAALGVGSFSVSTYLEWKMREPLYAVLMKVATIIAFVGAIFIGIAFATG